MTANIFQIKRRTDPQVGLQVHPEAQEPAPKPCQVDYEAHPTVGRNRQRTRNKNPEIPQPEGEEIDELW